MGSTYQGPTTMDSIHPYEGPWGRTLIIPILLMRLRVSNSAKIISR